MSRPPFVPRKIPSTDFCLRLSWPQVYSDAWKISSIEKSNNLIGNRTRDLEPCSIVPQPTTLRNALWIYVSNWERGNYSPREWLWASKDGDGRTEIWEIISNALFFLRSIVHVKMNLVVRSAFCVTSVQWACTTLYTCFTGVRFVLFWSRWYVTTKQWHHSLIVNCQYSYRAEATDYVPTSRIDFFLFTIWISNQNLHSIS
jgi:hypothetical protein